MPTDQVPCGLSDPAQADSKAGQSRAAIPALTGMRFVAAFWVVMFHSRLGNALTDHHMARAGQWITHGNVAVTLFFLLSGFVLSYNYRGRFREPAAKKRFYEARFARIWPAYVFSLIATSVATGFGFPPAWLIVTVLFMVQSWVPGNPGLGGAWNLMCWTLSVEAFYYVIMPFLQTWTERLRRRNLYVLVAITLVLGIIADCSAKSAHDLRYAGLLNYIPLPIIKLPEFILGGLVANILLLSSSRAWMYRTPFGMLTWVGVAGTLFVLGIHNVRLSWVLLPFLLLLLGLAVEKSLLSRILGSRLLVFGGAISYSMYLLQLAVKVSTRGC